MREGGGHRAALGFTDAYQPVFAWRVGVDWAIGHVQRCEWLDTTIVMVCMLIRL